MSYEKRRLYLDDARTKFETQFGLKQYELRSDRFVNGKDLCGRRTGFMDHTKIWRVAERPHRLGYWRGVPDVFTSSPYGVYLEREKNYRFVPVGGTRDKFINEWAAEYNARFVWIPGHHLHADEDWTLAFWRSDDEELTKKFQVFEGCVPWPERRTE